MTAPIIRATIVMPNQLPLISFKADVFLSMLAACRATNIELGWFGIVEKSVVGGRDKYMVVDYMIPPQRLATGGTCEIKDAELLEKMVADNRIDDIVKMRMWCHSHHTMGVHPSSQDEAQGLKCVSDIEHTKDNPGWYLTAIFNHKGELELGYFDKTLGIRLYGMPYVIDGGMDGLVLATVEELQAAVPFLSQAQADAIVKEENMKRYNSVITAKVAEMKPHVEAMLEKQKEFAPPAAVAPYGRGYGSPSGLGAYGGNRSYHDNGFKGRDWPTDALTDDFASMDDAYDIGANPKRPTIIGPEGTTAFPSRTPVKDRICARLDAFDNGRVSGIKKTQKVHFL